MEYEEVQYFTSDRKQHTVLRPKSGYREYDNVHLPVPFTGRFLLGAEPQNGYRIHMGIEPPFAYKKLIDMTFDQGRPIRTIDRSDAAEALRKKINLLDFNRGEQLGDPAEYLRSCFPSASEDDFWWTPAI